MADLKENIVPEQYFEKDNTFFTVAKTNPLDLVEKEIGDSKEPTKFLPQQKVTRWDNECNVSVRLVHDEKTPIVSQEGDIVKWSGDKIEAKFYDVVSEDLPEGASEFEVVLKEKPKTNVVQFTLVDKGVEYFYQPALTPEEIEQGAFRPENVVGSYAVYASENKTNYVGGKEYKCGKVGHIYRPQIEDSAGNKVWGELNVENGLLEVTIPQDFLDTAVYPVRHAAGLTFGYTSHGSAGGAATANDVVGGVYNLPENGIVTGISASLFVGGGTAQRLGKTAIYNGTTLVAGSQSNELDTAVSTTKIWENYTVSSLSLTAGDWTLVHWSAYESGSTYLSFDNTGSGKNGSIASVYGADFPSTITFTNENNKYSIYATYTPLPIEQEGFAFGDDDDTEDDHSLDTQDTNITEALGTKTLRTILNPTGDPASSAFKLKYQKNGSGGYIDVGVGSVNSAEAIYYFNSYGAHNFDANPGNIVDGNEATYGNDNDNGGYIRLDGNTCPGTDLGTITKVEIATYWSNNAAGVYQTHTPYFGANAGDGHADTNGLRAASLDTWHDITNDTNAPETWTWADVAALEDNVVVTRTAGQTQIRVVYIRVTYLSAPNEVYISASDNVTAGGEATTARLTAPSGKSGDFTTGRRWDDENGSDSIDIEDGHYTELEWILTTQSPAEEDDYFEFRVYNEDTALDTYTVTPKWTIGEAGGGGGDFVIADESSTSSIDNISLVQNGGTLSIADETSASSIDNIVLEYEGGTFAVADEESTSSIDNITLQFQGNFQVADEASASNIDNITIERNGGDFTIANESSASSIENIALIGNLQIDNAESSSLIDNVAIERNGGDFVIDDEISSSSIENISIQQSGSLLTADIETTSSIDNITLEQSGGTFAIGNEESASSIDNIGLIGNFQIADEESTSSIDNIVIVRNGGDFIVSDENSLSSIDAISLIGNLQIDDENSASTIDNIVLERNGGDFIIEDETSSSSIENISIQQSGSLLTADIETTSSIDNITLEQNGGTLAVGEIYCATEIDNIGLEGNFVIDGMTCGVTVEAVELEFNGATFEIADMSSTAEIESIPLVGDFIIQDINAPPAIDNVVLEVGGGDFTIDGITSLSSIGNVTIIEDIPENLKTIFIVNRGKVCKWISGNNYIEL